MKSLFAVALSLLLFLSACREKSKDDFDRTAMLTNLGNNIIVPAYQTFSTQAAGLKQKGDAFTASPSLLTLDSLKQAFIVAYTGFQGVEIYDFTASQDMRNMLNTFPTDTVQIASNVASGTYDLNTVNNLKAKGFPAVDYLLFSRSAQQTVDLFTTDANAAKRKQYLTDRKSVV